MANLYKDSSELRGSIFAAVPGLSVSESLFEGAHDIVFCIKNRRRQYVAVNSAFVARARVSNKLALLGRTAREIFPPLLAAGYEQQDDLVFATGQEVRDKLEMVTNPDGSTGWYLAQKVPVRNQRGEIIALAGASSDLGSPTARDPRLEALGSAIDRIHCDYSKPLRIAELARSAKMSLSQFERRVRSVLTVSPRQLLTKTRVDAAAKLLRETDRALQDVAVRCGFYDQALFCRQFRLATGMTPGQYRAASDTQ
jgi:AraC-like DNA-binding protein